MRVLLVHPSPLMYSEVYLKLEPLGLERVAQALRAAGHEVRLLDLQIFSDKDYVRELDTFKPRAVGFSLNYLANVPEVLDLAVATRSRRPETFIFAGGHSASFITGELLEHAAGALACVVRGEGEITAPRVLEALGDPRLDTVPGVVTRTGAATSSACSTRAPRPSSRAAVRGTARSAAPGPSTGAATGRPRPKAPPRTWRASPSPTCSWWTTSPSSTPSTASPSARRSSGAGSRRSTTWRRAATCLSRTARSSSTGSASACATCSSAWRRSTRKGSRPIASA